jgi:signal peptidase I
VSAQSNEEAAVPKPASRDTGDSTSGSWFMETLRTWGPAVAAVIVIRSFVFEPFSIPSGSMVPTLLIGDHVLVTKFSYGIWLRLPYVKQAYELIDLGDPARGDIAVFKYPMDQGNNVFWDGGTNYIKRVVGLPGDTVEVRNNQITINGELQVWEPTGAYSWQSHTATTCVERDARLMTETLSGVVHSVLLEERPSMLADYGPRTIPEGQVFVMGDNRDNSGDSRQGWLVDEDLIKGKAHFVWMSLDTCSGLSVRTRRIGQSLYSTVEPNIEPTP